MPKITIFETDAPILVFDSENWKNNEEYDDVAVEIINFIKKNDKDYNVFLIQNKSYYFGDTESNPIIMVHKNDFGGFSGTLELYIKDIVYDLIPEKEDTEDTN